MEAFARLYTELDLTTSTREKLAALVRYFASAPAEDAAWALYFLAGGRPRQPVPSKILRGVAIEASGLPEWLFDECHLAVGDFAETLAHVLPPPASLTQAGLAQWMVERVLPLRAMPRDDVADRLRLYWQELDWSGRFLFGKLCSGGFRVGVSRLLVTRALAQTAAIDPQLVAERLVGYTGTDRTPSGDDFRALLAPPGDDERSGGRPYPFFLAQPLAEPVENLGDVGDWLVEWKWDGIRAQLVRRGGASLLWSRGEELVTERFPELHALADALPDGTVLDGEIVAVRGEAIAPFAALATRIGRKHVSARLAAESPVAFVAYDLLESGGDDLRAWPLRGRRERLAALVAAVERPGLRLSPLVRASSWQELIDLREQSRARGVEGLMLKRRDAPYGVGRTGNAWWKWKIDPMSVDAVLVYAQRGHGRRASLYTDYTFAVWDERGGERTLLPFAKAYSGLTDDEIADVDRIVRRTTRDKFGPVRSVVPTLVFEVAFEGIRRSSRHKSGIAVRFPRILRWRRDKPVEEADTLERLHVLLG
ncbi:MAG TPA: ATP-dependent DNA ligase [Casimicrobiaceae bacterium]|nr:ATP-dependent DNA ligase [Casimicrobiaceae bacterium]